MGHTEPPAATNERVRIVVGVNRDDPATRVAVGELIAAARMPFEEAFGEALQWHLVLLDKPKPAQRHNDLHAVFAEGSPDRWPHELVAQHRLTPWLQGGEAEEASPDQRGVLRVADEALATAADVLVILTHGAGPHGEPDRGFLTLRRALEDGKPVLWIRQDAAEPERLLSSLANHSTTLYRLSRLGLHDRLEAWLSVLLGKCPDDQKAGERLWSEAAAFDPCDAQADIGRWFARRVMPALDRETLLRSMAVQRAVENRSAHRLEVESAQRKVLEQLAEADRPNAALKSIGDPCAGCVHRFFSWLCAVPSRARPAPQASAQEALPDACAAADRGAATHAGRYRDTVWIGYLAACIAVTVAACGAVFSESPPPDPHGAVLLFAVLAGLVTFATVWFWWRGRHQPPHHNAAAVRKWGYVAVAAAVATLIVDAVFGAQHKGFAFEAILLIVMITRVARVWSSHAHERWLACRALAEALRYDAMLAPLMMRCRVSSQARLRLRDADCMPALGSAVAWQAAHLEANESGARPLYGSTAFSLASRKHMEQALSRLHGTVLRQLRYQRERHARELAVGETLHLLSNVSILLALICVALHFGLDSLPGQGAKLAQLGAIALPAWGAALHAIRTQLEMSRLASASFQVVARLAVHDRLLSAGEDRLRELDGDIVPWHRVEDLRALALEASDAMSHDLLDWFDLVSAQPMPLPA